MSDPTTSAADRTPREDPKGAADLRRFVREGLGCACPEEVLQRIRTLPPPPSLADLPVDWLLEVGGRLLVLMCGREPGPDLLVRLGETALRLRDAGGFHRVRIVLPAVDPLQPPAFGPPALDERGHWHRVPAGDWPAYTAGA